MQKNLLRFQDKQKYFLFDLETCHLNLASTDNKPWQVGYIVGEGKHILEVKSHMIKWSPLNITEGAARVTHFDKKIYEEKAEDPKLIYDILAKYLYNQEYIILGHNILGFDVYLLEIYRKLLGLKSDYSFIHRCIDTNAIAKAIELGVKPREGEDELAFQYSMLNHKQKGLKTNLTVLGNKYKIDFDPEKLHNAEEDVKLNWQIWNQMVWEIDI